jgi:hypothetical protein
MLPGVINHYIKLAHETTELNLKPKGDKCASGRFGRQFSLLAFQVYALKGHTRVTGYFPANRQEQGLIVR